MKSRARSPGGLSPLRPRAFGGLALVSLAYEVLRDPAKRRAYDASLGVDREPAMTEGNSINLGSGTGGESRTGFAIAVALRDSSARATTEPCQNPPTQSLERISVSMRATLRPKGFGTKLREFAAPRGTTCAMRRCVRWNGSAREP